jgi:hypothetical protein
MTSNDVRKRLTMVAAAAALAGSGAALAQDGYGQQGQQGQQGDDAYQQPAQGAQQADDFSNDELKSFAKARQQVTSISQEFQSEMQEAEDPAKVSEMQAKANQEMVEAVRDVGLEPAEYNAIANAVRSDPELEEKVKKIQ